MPTIISETKEFLILNKPAGLITHSDGRTIEPSFAEWLASERPAQRGVGEPWVSPQGESIDVAGLVHRLDRTTSGIMLAAKTDAIFAELRQMLKRREVQKTYRVLVYGALHGKGRIVAEIERTSEKPRKWRARPCEENDVRAAITNWTALATFNREGQTLTYLEIHPETGRTHQIRVHLASIDHPIVADHVYASEKPSLGYQRLMLHAYGLAFSFGGVVHDYRAPLPEEFPQD